MIANKATGEVLLNLGDAAYQMRLDMNALAELEAYLGGDVNAMELLQNPAQLNASKTRAMFFFGLKQCHPDMTMQLAGRILSANIARFGDVLEASFPEAEPGNGAAG